jgi:hypothetical protein
MWRRQSRKPGGNLNQRGVSRFSDGDANGSIVCDVGAYEHCPDADSDNVCVSEDNCPNWPNPAQTLPSWPVPADDPDCDGWDNTRETHVGTDPTKHCNNTTTANDEPDYWPTDFNDSRSTNLSDVILMGPSYNKSNGQAGYNQRFDLNASNTVNLSDVILLGPFYNKGCG